MVELYSFLLNTDSVSPREKLCGRKINVDKELLYHGFGDYV